MLASSSSSLRGAFRQQQPFKASRASTVRVEANKRVQKKAKVILTKDLENVGKEGELLTVPIGYLRNYLLPNGIARVASDGILEKLRKKKEDAVRAKLEEKAQAQAFANALGTIGKFILKKKTGDKDQLFAVVQKQEVIDAVYQQTSRLIDEKDLTLPDIKAVGTFEAQVRLHPEVVGTFSVVIQKEKVQQGKKK
ncbi:50S ribosomal protein L9 [Monoraphidium neglectum]|uniref:Large ribosomal subunit protein bL9c n=1 Tax=Monoraphidium neglectum TaxID=145388 RepID=A0A0D2N095_9CHLO|nr:50S ribosomal protein L9 [Monoraphidium neglectum]KIZ05982.1 50S ribosomal protein L9 [Monoraphidium neglectum]|eukprot:XP_013905001.1 50S ribosomal protein L9 [Monoraphidium neglectum]